MAEDSVYIDGSEVIDNDNSANSTHDVECSQLCKSDVNALFKTLCLFTLTDVPVLAFFV